jgi:hypothetical protein
MALENERAAADGETINPSEFNSYRIWQKGGEIAAGTVLGLSLGALFGIVFAYARESIPNSSNKKKALILAGVMWLVCIIHSTCREIPGKPAGSWKSRYAIVQAEFVHYLSGNIQVRRFRTCVSAPKAWKHAAKESHDPGSLCGNHNFMAYLAMPPNPDEITAPMDLVIGFRLANGFTMSIFWELLGIILGAFLEKLNPETAKITI